VAATADPQGNPADLPTATGEEVLDLAARAAAEQPSERIRQAHPDIQTLSVHGSRDGQAMEVVAPRSLNAAQFSRILPPGAAKSLPVRVIVEPSLRSTSTGGVVGGAELNSPSGEKCTSGFTVKNPRGVPYLLTAGHCAGSQKYGQYPWLANSEWERRGNYGDHTTSGESWCRG